MKPSDTSLGAEDDKRVEDYFDQQVNSSREKLAEIMGRWIYGITPAQLFADGIRPVGDLANLQESLEFLLAHGIAQLHTFESVIHRSFVNSIPYELHIEGKFCPCEPTVQTTTMLFHLNNINKIPIMVKSMGCQWISGGPPDESEQA